MKELSEGETRELLQEYEPLIVEAFDKAVKTLNDHTHACFTKRTRSSMVRDLAVEELKKSLRGMKDIQIITKHNTTFFRFGESIIGKVKQLDKKRKARYNLTPSSDRFTSQLIHTGDQFELFGSEYRLTSVHIGYVLDDFGIGIREVIVTCPINSGRSNKWMFKLQRSIPQAAPVETNKGRDERFRINREKRKDQSKNDRTGEGGQRANPN